MIEVKFWDFADECIKVNDVYTATCADEVMAEIYIQEYGKQALYRGATFVTMSNEKGVIREFDIMFDDDYNVILDEYTYDDYDDYTGNMSCDSTGFCSGYACPNFSKCKG